MYRFFIKEEQIHDGMIEICGSDVNHIKNVLRMKTGDKVYLSNGSDLEYECSLLEWTDDTILAKIEEFAASLGSKCYPVVVANILADVISPLIEIVDQFLAEDGVFVISGIIDTKEKEIADKLNAYGFDVIETRRMKDWVSMTAKMR